MQIIDLTDAYCKHILKGSNLAAYQRAYPALFSHYFRFWASKKYWHITLKSEAALQKRRQLILAQLPRIERMFDRHNLSIKKLTFVLFVGQNTTNGHAFFDKNKCIVWIPIEAYETALQVTVFVTHEIVHALHYAQKKSFYFTTAPEQRLLSRQLITEGIATWISQRLTQQTQINALWGDYLSPRQKDRWLVACKKQERGLKQFIDHHFHSTSTSIQLFQANDSKNIFTYRAGYYTGLQAIKKVAALYNNDYKKLLLLPKHTFEKLVRELYLKN